jgi:predicted solute-binding protein
MSTLCEKTIYTQLKTEFDKYPELLSRFKTDLTVHDQKRINALKQGAVLYVMGYSFGTYSAIASESALLDATNDELIRYGPEGVKRNACEAILGLAKHVKEENKTVKIFKLTVSKHRLQRAYGTVKEVSMQEFIDSVNP